MFSWNGAGVAVRGHDDESRGQICDSAEHRRTLELHHRGVSVGLRHIGAEKG